MVLERLGDGTRAHDNGDKREPAAFLTSALIRLAQLQQMIHPIISSKLLMHLRDRGALSWESNSPRLQVGACTRARW